MPRPGLRHPLILLLLLALLAGVAEARFEWRDVVQDVTILPDGTVIVNDERTLWTDEDFAEAFICFEHGPNQRIVLLPDSGAIDPGPPAVAFTQSCESGAQGTEMVIRHQQRIQQRRVRFHYRFEGSVEAYSDVVQWYWNVIQRDHPPIIGYRLTVIIPGPMSAPYDAYVHRYSNPEEPTVTLSPDRSRLSVQFDRIPPGDGVEIRYLMDPALFTIRGNQARFEQLLQDEARVAGLQERLLLEEQERQRALQRRSNPALALPGAALLLWLLAGVVGAYRRFGREPALPQMRYPFEPPSDIPPAAVTAMLHQTFSPSVMGPGFHATIMDLARRGYGRFTGKGRKFEMVLLPGPADDPLEPFERDVLDYLHVAAAQRRRGDDHHLEFRELKAYSQKNGQKFLRRWGPRVRKWVEARFGGPLVAPESRRAAMRWSGLAFLVAAGCALGSWLGFGGVRVLYIVFGAVAFITIFVAGSALPAWRPEVAAEVYGWQGFRRTLSDYTRMKDAPDDFFRLWDRYYCYAAALGVAQRFLANLQRAAPLRGLDEGTMMRQASWLGDTSSASSFAAFSSSAAALSSALASASASASSGGSSSGGGGGGGGGGSSGGR